MNILHVMGARSTKWGGVENWLYNLIKTDSKNQYIIVYDSQPACEEYVEALRNLNCEVVVIDTRGKKYIKNFIKYVRLIASVKPAALYFHFGESFKLWALYAKLIGINKIFLVIHCEINRNNSQVKNIQQLGIKARLTFLNGWIYRLFNSIFCVSKAVLNQQISIFGNNGNFKLLYLGTADIPSLSSSRLLKLKSNYHISDEVILTTILFAVPFKGCDILIKSMEYIPKAISYKLMIIGLDEYSQYTIDMHKLAESLGVDDKIIWVGITNDVQQYLAITDIYIQPSRTEALSLAAVEAASNGIPIIGSDVGGLPEISSVLFPVGNSKILACEIEDLIVDTEKRRELGRERRTFWENNMQLSDGINRFLIESGL